MSYPPCNPSLALSAFYLFPNMKKKLTGKKFMSDKDVKDATSAYFPDKNKTFLYEGMRKLTERSKKCVGVPGELIHYIAIIIFFSHYRYMYNFLIIQFRKSRRNLYNRCHKYRFWAIKFNVANKLICSAVFCSFLVCTPKKPHVTIGKT